MSSIFYESQDREVHQIDEVSQRILVYAYLHSRSQPDDMIEPVGVDNNSAIHSRVESQLGPNGSGLARIDSTQQTIGQGPPIHYVELTEDGAAFVETHRAELSMPADIAELAKRVAALEIEDKKANLINRLNELEYRVEELQG